MTVFTTTDEVLDALGGNTPVAVLTSTTPKVVSNWRTCGKFPSNTFIILKTELLKRGASAPDRLWSMREPRAVRKRA